jgi:serine/threonine protein kinase/uncharacterized protein HemY
MPDYLKEARRARRQGDYSKAGDFFFLGGDEKSAMDMYLKGGHYMLAARLLEKQQDWKGAAKFYIQSGKLAEAAEIYGGRLKDFRMAAAMFEKNGDLLRASDMAERAGDLSRAALLADHAELLERAAKLYVQAEKYERAADVYRRILKTLLREGDEKGFLETHRNRVLRFGNAAGNLYYRMKQFDQAGECFEIAGNLAKAAESYARGKNIEKSAELFSRLQQYQKAYDLFTRVAETCERKELFADVCFQLKKFNEAADLYLQTNRVPRVAESYEAAGDYYRAALFYESFEEYAKAAELYLKLNEPERAGDLYERAKNFDFAAKFYQEAGNTRKAIDCLIQSGKRIAAAKLQIEKEQIQQAVSLLQQIPFEDEDYPDACLLLGQLFSNMGMFTVAQQKLQEAINKQPISTDNIELFYHLALLYERVAQYSRARELLEQIVSVDLKYKDAYARLKRIKASNLLDGVLSDGAPGSLKRIIGGRYELLEKIGKDAFGVLYRAKDLSLGRIVMIRRFAQQDKNITRAIVDQIKIVAGMSHPNIVAIYDSGKDEDHYYICMEYVDGGTLRKYLSRGPLDISEICEFASQICLALGYAHKKGVVHKNLSPENIYVGQGNQIKIANFGIEAKPERGSTLIAKQYTSPEQVLGEKVDARSDLYVFGIVMYEMTYGSAPFAGQDVELQHLKKIPSFPEVARHAVPIFLMKIMQKCMRKDRHKRYASAEEILEELEIADIVPGMVINERYEIIRQLGSGGMGHVYQARDRDLDEIVAVKVLKAEFSADPGIQKRFLREIKMTRMVTHPHVVKVFDTGRYKGNRYISMEYIEGMGLDDWLRKNKPDVRTLLMILAKIMQGVQAAHSQSIIHRDLKPQNVLLDRVLNPHVLDFGIARFKDNVDSTSGQVMGSPKYMSPEQIQGKDLDNRSDIYSLGVLMFYLFTGEEPFTGEDPRSIIMKHLTQQPPSMRKINPAVPEWLEKIVSKTLEKDRNQRYSSLKEILDELKKGYESHKV